MIAPEQLPDSRSALMALLLKHVGRERITDDAELYRDLLLIGDDADEFLNEFAKLFGISGFEHFHFDDYFPSEGYGWFWPRWFGARDKRRGRITVAHLLNVIEKKSWVDPPIQDHPAFSAEIRSVTPRTFWLRVVAILALAVAVILFSLGC